MTMDMDMDMDMDTDMDMVFQAMVTNCYMAIMNF